MDCEHDWVYPQFTGPVNMAVCKLCRAGYELVDGEWIFKSYVDQRVIDLTVQIRELRMAVEGRTASPTEVLRIAGLIRDAAKALNEHKQ